MGRVFSQDKFTMENIHGYVKRTKKPPMTFNMVNSEGVKETNQDSSLDTNMKPQLFIV